MPAPAHTVTRSARVIGDPWTLQTVAGGSQFPAITTLTTWGTLTLDSCQLTPAHGRTLAAFHEAGHAVLFHALGFEVTRASIYPDDPHAPGPGQGPGDGHTELGAAPRFPDPSGVITAILAGHAAAEMWLEHAGLLNPRSSLLAYSISSSDHERLLAAGGALFLYGDAEPPPDWDGSVFHIDALARVARRRLACRWPAVAAVARRLDEHGSISAGELDAIETGTRAM